MNSENVELSTITQFESIKPDVFEPFELPSVPELAVKSRSQWAKELNEFGLKGDSSVFKFRNQITPMSIVLADKKFIDRCGENPRIAIEKCALSDEVFKKVKDELGLIGKKSLGLTFEGFDFEDQRSTKELGSFLHHFETRYRQIKQQQLN